VLDDRRQTFRYSAMKTGPHGARVLEQVRPGQQHFDIVAVAEPLREAGTMVLYGVSGVLDDYCAYQADMADW
jgi:hypothetical protein